MCTIHGTIVTADLTGEAKVADALFRAEPGVSALPVAPRMAARLVW